MVRLDYYLSGLSFDMIILLKYHFVHVVIEHAQNFFLIPNILHTNFSGNVLTKINVFF